MTESSNFTRRTALWAAGLGGAFSLAGFPALGDGTRAALARAAYIWGLPLVQTRLYLKLMRQRSLPLNQFFVAPRLATPADKGMGAPNVDTLYGVAWLDLIAQPQIFSVPDTHDRYYAVQFIDAYENSFRYVGRRTTGTKAGHFAIVGPDWSGRLPEGVTRIAAPTKTVCLFSRTLVESEADLPAALAVQAGYTLTTLSDYPRIDRPVRLLDNPASLISALHAEKLGIAYFDELSAALVEYPPPASDQNFVNSLAVLGIGPGETPSRTDDKQLQNILAAAVVSANAEIRQRFTTGATYVNGWRVRYGIESFIADPLERASENVFGIGYNVAEEGLFFFGTTGSDGKPLSGEKNYTLSFSAGNLPPVSGFWSVTLYGLDWYFQANPINRYAIGDRTSGLHHTPGGGLQIFIQNAAPVSGTSNWLPAPVGPFMLAFRTYQPQAPLINGTYKLPPIILA